MHFPFSHLIDSVKKIQKNWKAKTFKRIFFSLYITLISPPHETNYENTFSRFQTWFVLIIMHNIQLHRYFLYKPILGLRPGVRRTLTTSPAASCWGPAAWASRGDITAPPTPARVSTSRSMCTTVRGSSDIETWEKRNIVLWCFYIYSWCVRSENVR